MEQFIPDFLRPLLQEQFDDATINAIYDGYQQERVTTFRANTLLADRDEIAAALTAADIPYTTVPWYADAFALTQRNERLIWDQDFYEQGKVYLQSLSSMLPPLALGVKPGIDILDVRGPRWQDHPDRSPLWWQGTPHRYRDERRSRRETGLQPAAPGSSQRERHEDRRPQPR